MGYKGKFQKAKLGPLCRKIGSGATPRGGKDAYLESGPFSLIRSQNVHNNQFTKEGLAFISPKQADELDNVQVEAGDVLLNITGDSVARCCQAPQDVLPARVNQHVAIIRPDSGLLDPQFLRYFLVSPQMQEHMLMLAGAGATRNALTKGMIEDFDVPKPDITEQREIARVLGTLDDKIDLNRRINKTLEELTQTIFKSCFVNVAATNLPKGWRQGTLGEVAENPRRSIQPDEIEYSTPYIGLEHMPRRCIALSEWGLADELESNKLEFKQNEILFGKLRPYFHKVGVAPLDGVCSTDILVVSPKELGWFGFVLGHISSVELVNHTDAASTGTKMPRSNWNDISRFEVALPPESLAAEFTERIRPLIDRIIANIHESHTLAELRDALLPRLLSGELPVPKVKPPQEKQAEFNIVPLPIQSPSKSKRKATDEFVEAIVIAQFTRGVSDATHPLGRKRYNKFAYLAHRKAEHDVTTHYLKKAAGPYSPWAKYQGPEKIACENGYVKSAKVGELTGFVPGDKIADIERYVPKYPICAAVDWVVAKFKFRKNDDLELLATVDYAALDLIVRKQPVSFEGVKQIIATNKEWAAKLKREIFSDANIKRALTELHTIFPGAYAT
ncbi:MAG TPA: restriction endonuclease subunit S [Candidatus Acidoferrales bacterium]|jgi:type I restriction enzyme S subunit|nr:restriction endonuclease subunit S [Candidatus Acidoferrales bacterium]